MSYKDSGKHHHVDTAILLDDLKEGADDGKITWHVDRNCKYKVMSKEGKFMEMRGAFHSEHCARTVPVKIKDSCMSTTCSACENIIHSRSFRRRALFRTKRKEQGERMHVREEYLTLSELRERHQSAQKKYRQLQGKLFFAKSRILKESLRSKNLKEKLVEFSKRGSINGICHQLSVAAEKGQLEDHHVLKDVLETTARNFHVEKHGKRYKASVKMFYEVLLMWGGPRLAVFVALNLNGPEIHSIYKWRKQKDVHLSMGVSSDNFHTVGLIYKEIMEKQQIPKVPVLLAEDETAIIGRLDYCAKSDQLLGACGINGPDHRCVDSYTVEVGEGEDGYRTIMSAFKDCRIGTYGRALILNPLHPDLPKIPILVMPTCNRFDHEFVQNQWDQVAELYQETLEPILGPLIGNSSDGDTRRRKLQLKRMTSNDGYRFQPIPANLGFAMSCQVHDGNDAMICGLGDQDYIHNHKKLLNPLDHSSRTLTLGNHRIHMNDLRLVTEIFEYDRHRLSSDDINRTDRQNWLSAQKLCLPRVTQCLQDLQDGECHDQRPHVGVAGTLAYMKIVWNYVNIFCSTTYSLESRIISCAMVTHFLAIWHNNIVRTDGLHTATHFISRETYIDVVLSCHFAVMLISFMAKSFPHVACRLDLTGTDMVEDFWSKNGQWIGNHHNYSLGDLRRNLSHMIRLENIRIDPLAPEFAKPHPKQESIWHTQNAPDCIPADLRQYPTADETISAWEEGIKKARRLLHSVGISPQDFDPDNPEDSDDVDENWFYKPFAFPQNKLYKLPTENAVLGEDEVRVHHIQVQGNMESNFIVYILFFELIQCPNISLCYFALI